MRSTTSRFSLLWVASVISRVVLFVSRIALAVSVVGFFLWTMCVLSELVQPLQAQQYLSVAPRPTRHQLPYKLADGGTLRGYWTALSLRQANGSDITSWPSSDQWATAMTNTANYPTMNLTGLNGKPAASFNGSSQSLSAGDIARFRVGIPHTYLVVLQPSSVGTQVTAFSRSGASGYGQIELGQYGGTMQLFNSAGSSALYGNLYAATLTGSPGIYVAVVTGPDATHYTKVTQYKNGVYWDSKTVASTAYSAGAGELKIGMNTPSTYPRYWPGTVGAVALWSGAATYEEVRQISQAAGYQYSLPVWPNYLDPAKFTAPQVATTLPLVSPDDSNSLVQPDVEDTCDDPPTCSTIIGGHRYWMAVTGYLNGSGSNEYTRIFSSDDKFATSTLEATLDRHGVSEADPNIFKYDNNLHVVTVGGGGIQHVQSLDGTSWSPTRNTLATPSGSVFCPSVIHDTRKAGTIEEWALYYHEVSTYKIKVMYSATFPNPGGWSAPRDITINGNYATTWWVGTGLNHSSLTLHNGIYFMIALQANYSALYMATSLDGKVWQMKPGLPLLAKNGEPWNSAAIYKGSKMLWTSAINWDFYYSGSDVLVSNNWRVARTEGTYAP